MRIGRIDGLKKRLVSNVWWVDYEKKKLYSLQSTFLFFPTRHKSNYVYYVRLTYSHEKRSKCGSALDVRSGASRQRFDVSHCLRVFDLLT